MEGSKIKKITILIILICSINLYGESFDYQKFDYMFQNKGEKEFQDRVGDIIIENSLTKTDIILRYNTENKKIQFKLNEKVRAKLIEILQKYLAWAELAEKKGIKMDKYIDKIENIKIISNKNGKENEIIRNIEFNLFFYDLEKYYLSIEFTELQGKRAEKIYLNRDQVIEMMNKINEDAIKDGIKLHEMNMEF